MADIKHCGRCGEDYDVEDIVAHATHYRGICTRKRIAALEAELAERCDQLRQWETALSDERAAHARTQAEAAALRAASTTLLRALSDSEDNADEVIADAADGLSRALTGNAGRAIAERVPRLEALRGPATGIVNALSSKEARELMHRDASFADHYKTLRLALAALDEKGGGK